MSINFHDKEALITAAVSAGTPVAFLVGSPLSTKDGVGVPGVKQMLDLAREEIRQRASSRLLNFEAAIQGKSAGDAYQAAMTWLNGNLLQSGVNRVINKAVRLARKAGSAADFTQDGKPGDWHLPAGTHQLASLICRDRERFPGPVLTTNFDPLLSLAVESCGGIPHLRVIQADGGLAHDVKRTGETEIVHLHGFWRDSDTLHSPAQLTAPRPRLKDSLKEILRQKTLIVAAYGGWDDVFATALTEIAIDESAEVNVLWCFRDNDPAKIEHDYQKLFQRVQPAITRGRFVTYQGIDCHSIFGEIAAALPLPTAASASSAPSAATPIPGWQEIDSPFLDALPALTSGEIVSFFDGAVPTWRHAVSPGIPRREDVARLVAGLTAAVASKTPRTLQLIRAAGGEGKSTLLLQTATDLIRAGGWSVLWRTSPHEGISPTQIAQLDPARRWLIVADDADTIVPGLAETARALNQSGRPDFHFLLATRDTDWSHAGGNRQEWPLWLTYLPELVLRGISAHDAKTVVAAWEMAGPDGLRELNAIGDTAQRIAIFESAVRDATTLQHSQDKGRLLRDGSFFGGLLAVRFGQNGLHAHVRTFLQRLQTIPIERGKGTLFDALLYVAACHGTGIPGIDERVLADLVGVPRAWVQSRVVRPLGAEAAAVQSAGHVLTRHSHVAATVLVEAEHSLGTDLAEIWAALVRQTVLTSRSGGVSYDTHPKILHAGPRLERALPKAIPPDRRKSLSIAAAIASSGALPERLDCVVDLGKTYRFAQQPEQAAGIFRDNLAAASTKIDYSEVIRGYWYEWSVCEGESGKTSGANAWLGGLSLSDHLNPAPITPERVKLSCAGLGVAFGKLAQPSPDCRYAKARRAAAYLGRLGNCDTKAARFFAAHDREADKIRTPRPCDIDEAIRWLAAGIVQTGNDLKDPFLKSLLDPSAVSFTQLQTVLSPSRRPAATARGASRPSPAPAAPATQRPLQITSPLQSRIEADIERVKTRAWASVPADTAPEDRFATAKKEAVQLISKLSPDTKRRVEAHFRTQNWEPLRSRDPERRAQ